MKTKGVIFYGAWEGAMMEDAQRIARSKVQTDQSAFAIHRTF
jgi:hypothetical protein